MALPWALGRCLVTGAAGFIGSHMVERLLAEGSTVTGYDNLSLGRMDNLLPVLEHPRFSFVQADLLGLETLKRTMAGHDLVVHLGANTEIQRGNQDPRIDLENCTMATFNVLEAMRTTGVRRVLFASSACVYGDHPIRPYREELGPLMPISMYGAAKLACEALISSYSHLYDVRGLMFRFGNVVGARMGHGVVYDFIHKLRNNPRELEVLGDGNQIKNYVLVEECVDGMLFAHQQSKEQCDVFNLGTDTITRAVEIAQIVCQEMDLKDVRFRFTGGKRGWPGDQPHIAYDTSKIARLGWRVKHTSSEAVRIAARRLLGKGG